MRDAPYIVVGGGLAGAAFALELARHGTPVMVVESTRTAHHKVCGGLFHFGETFELPSAVVDIVEVIENLDLGVAGFGDHLPSCNAPGKRARIDHAWRPS